MSLKTVFSSVALLSSVDSVVGLRLRMATSAPPSLDALLGNDSLGKWSTVRAANVVLGLGTEKINKSDCNSVNLKRHIEKSYDMLKPLLERFEDDCEGSAKKATLEKSWVDEMDNLVRMHDKILADPKNDCRQENVADMLSLKDEYPTQLLVGEAAYAQGKQLLRESLERADAVKIEDEKHPQWFSLSGSTEKGNRRPANVSVKHWVDMRTSQMLKTALGNWKKRVSDLAAGVHFECKTDKELGHVFHFKSAVALALYTAEDIFGKLNWMARTGPFAPGADPLKLQDSDYYKTWESLHNTLSLTLENEMHVHKIAPQPEVQSSSRATQKELKMLEEAHHKVQNGRGIVEDIRTALESHFPREDLMYKKAHNKSAKINALAAIFRQKEAREDKKSLWRGLGFPTKEIRDKVLASLVRKDPDSDDHIFKSQEFMSTSTDRKVAERYMSGYNSEQSTKDIAVWSRWSYGILFQIKENKTGKSIKKYSTWGAEEEVLYRPDTKFRRTEIQENYPCPSETVARGTQLASDNGCVLVVVEEI
jgi:hypothetical protein